MAGTRVTEETNTEPGRRGRRPTFLREELIATARRLGPDDIGLQAVSDQLGVARTSLYWHVRDSEELGRLVLQAIIDEETTADWCPGPSASWEDWLAGYAAALRHALLAAGPWMRYGATEYVFTDNALRVSDRVIEALRDAGFNVTDAARALVLVAHIARSIVLDEFVVSDAPRAAFDDRIEDFGPLELPHLRQSLAAAGAADPAEEFAFELRCCIAGLAACVVRRSEMP